MFIKLFKKDIRYLPRVVLTALDNILVYLFNKMPNRGPLYVGWDMTRRCDCRCQYCDWWKAGDVKELSFKEKLEVIRKLGKAGIWMVSFCGGEPLLQDEITLLIKEAKNNGLCVNLSTNGSLLISRYKEIIDSGLDSIIISVDSHVAGVHDELRGRPGLFSDIVKGMELIKNTSRKRPLISVRTLVTKLNYSNLDEYVAFWFNRVDNILLQPIHEGPNQYFKIPDNLRFTQLDENKFRLYYKHLLKKYKFLRTSYNKAIPNFLFCDDWKQRNNICLSGILFAAIDPGGNLYFCSKRDKQIDNLVENDFLELWANQKTRKMRHSQKQNLDCKCLLNATLPSVYINRLRHLGVRNK